MSNQANNQMADMASFCKLDEMARKHQLSYVRYMDDIVIFSKTRHQLKRIIKGVYACLDELALTLARDKTWIGRVSKGFDFLGYHRSGFLCFLEW